MNDTSPGRQADMAEELEALRIRLHEAEETLAAIRNGEVDALAIQGTNGPRIFTLQSADQVYRSLIEGMNEGALLLDGNDIVLYCNACLASLLDVPLGKMIGSCLRDLVPAEFLAHFGHLTRQAWAGGTKGELPLKTASGVLVPFSVSAHALNYHDMPALGVILADLSAQQEINRFKAQVETQNEIIARNNQDLQRQEMVRREIEESENRFRAIADTAPVLIWMSDTHNDRIFFNKSWLGFTGRTQEEETGRGWTKGIHAADLARCKDTGQTAFQARQPFHMEYRLRHHSGQHRWLSDSGVPRHDSDGTFMGYIGSCMDVTERRTRTQELEKRVAERTQELQAANLNLERSNIDLERFAYVASHDLQEPLRKITTVSSRLSKTYGTELGDEGKTMLGIMANAATRMKILIESLLAYSRVARKEAEFEKTDLDSVIGNILTDFELRIRETGAEVHYQGLPAMEVIPQQMHQLFQNLISNALKFAKSGEPPRIRIHWTPLSDREKQDNSLDESREYVNIQVMDNGIGFENQYAERIFELFQRLHGNAEYGGTGIGLAICKQVVENHGGLIAASSLPGSGSTFSLTLPLQQPAAPKTLPSTAPVAAALKK